MFQAVVVVVVPLLANEDCGPKINNVGEQKLTVLDSMKAPSICIQNDKPLSLVQEEQRDSIS